MTKTDRLEIPMIPLEQYQADVMAIEAEKNSKMESVIAEAHDTIAALTEKIRQYEERNKSAKARTADKRLFESEAYRRFKYLESHTSESPTADDWMALSRMFNDVFPEFQTTLNSSYYMLSEKELCLCMLIRLNFNSSVIANFVNTTKSNVSMMRSRLLQKMYGISGTPREFDRHIREI